MSFVSKMLGKKKSSSSKSGSGSSAPEAIQKLLAMSELLVKKQTFLESKIEKEISNIKRLGAKGQRSEALKALKRKKKLESNLQQIDSLLTTIDFQRESLESSHTNAEVVKVMNQARSALKVINGGLKVTSVEDMMDEIKELSIQNEDIGAALSAPLGDNEDDDEELMKELEMMEQEEREKEEKEGKEEKEAIKKKDEIGKEKKKKEEKEEELEVSLQLPEVPRSKLKTNTREEKEEEQLQELEKWAT